MKVVVNGKHVINNVSLIAEKKDNVKGSQTPRFNIVISLDNNTTEINTLENQFSKINTLTVMNSENEPTLNVDYSAYSVLIGVDRKLKDGVSHTSVTLAQREQTEEN